MRGSKYIHAAIQKVCTFTAQTVRTTVRIGERISGRGSDNGKLKCFVTSSERISVFRRK